MENIVDYRVRRLTASECWKLMGFTSDDYNKAKSVNSNTQLYKQAGNSIVVDVLCHLMKDLFSEYIQGGSPENFTQPELKR